MRFAAQVGYLFRNYYCLRSASPRAWTVCRTFVFLTCAAGIVDGIRLSRMKTMTLWPGFTRILPPFSKVSCRGLCRGRNLRASQHTNLANPQPFMHRAPGKPAAKHNGPFPTTCRSQTQQEYCQARSLQVRRSGSNQKPELGKLGSRVSGLGLKRRVRETR